MSRTVSHQGAQKRYFQPEYVPHHSTWLPEGIQFPRQLLVCSISYRAHLGSKIINWEKNLKFRVPKQNNDRKKGEEKKFIAFFETN